MFLHLSFAINHFLTYLLTRFSHFYRLPIHSTTCLT